MALDLTGDWLGQFDYPRKRKPVSFSAELCQSGDWLTGSIKEVASLGPRAGFTISSMISGGTDGLNVTFLKTYNDHSSPYDAVSYAGEVTPDGLEISGTWKVTERWSGPFLMIRSKQKAVAVQVQDEEKV